MIKNEYRVIGVMSGTSLDGVDLVYAIFNFDKGLNFEIRCSETVPYDSFWYSILSDLVSLDKKSLAKIDQSYTLLIAEIIKGFIKKNNIEKIDAICSHGHTALHRPEKSLTYQIGNRPELAKLLNQNVVCDFRVQDVQLGGQGAPLVPIGDRLLFSEYDYCINLGGFANISYEVKGGKRIAFDICPVNVVLNEYSKKLGLSYDDGGQIAKKGIVNRELLRALNQLQFFKANPPKSLGLEWVKSEIFPLIRNFEENPVNVISTFTEHISIQISEVVKEGSKILFTGGGTFNRYLLERISAHNPVSLKVPENQLIEFKEALIFALLGVLKLRGEINCLASVTGASQDHSSGKIYKS